MTEFDTPTRRTSRSVVTVVLLAAALLHGCRATPDAKPPGSSPKTPPPANADSRPPTSTPAPAVSHSPPAAGRPAQGEPTRITSNDGAFVVRFTTDPSPIPHNELFEIVAEVSAAGGEALPDDAILEVDAAMPEHNHGMITRPRVTRLPDGRYRVRGMLFHMSGRWVLYFDVTRGGVTSRAEAEVVLE